MPFIHANLSTTCRLAPLLLLINTLSPLYTFHYHNETLAARYLDQFDIFEYIRFLSREKLNNFTPGLVVGWLLIPFSLCIIFIIYYANLGIRACCHKQSINKKSNTGIRRPRLHDSSSIHWSLYLYLKSVNIIN
jgi:hypothetical protein